MVNNSMFDQYDLVMIVFRTVSRGYNEINISGENNSGEKKV